ncbi:DNA polymerase III subunit delta [Coxiella-like endosymbiont]|uniref:DNA polymerase III subunit delta n=1 Tax=Coxiella-like endosymbiont TaxID=1592897 RepID=UPI000C80A133|nr:DNA polymerase III subunit delta [Coxiella-like endosymbiont]
MQISSKQLNTHLNQTSLLPIYLICSDIPLLVQETRDSIRQAAWQQGFQKGELFFIETGFNWQVLKIAIDNFNLFSEKIFIEIRNPQATFDEQTTQILLHYLKNPPPNKRLLIITNKLTATQQKTKWYKAVSKFGAVIPLWPISTQELPTWIAERFKKFNLTIDMESINLLLKLTEGNLLATQQVIEKLCLLYQNKLISPQTISAITNDNPCFKIFDLTEAVLLGQTSRVTRILLTLKFVNKEAAPLVLWSLTHELRNLYMFFYELKNGKCLSELLASQGKTRKQALQIALSRLNPQLITKLLQRSKQVDWMIKGIIPGNTWQALERLSLAIAGKELR